MPKVNRVLPVIMSALIVLAAQPVAFAGDSEPKLNFKIYSPEGPSTPPEEGAAGANEAKSSPDSELGGLKEETPTEDKIVEEAPKAAPDKDTVSAAGSDNAADTATPASKDTAVEPSTTSSESASGSASQPIENPIDPEVKDANAKTTEESKQSTQKQVLQGFIRVVPKDTKIPIIMDTAVDSDTSQEGDEFAARTAEDLNIDGQVAVPAGSIIKGRIARINLPRALNRSGNVALKFDTVTTPDNKQIPIVANLVARGGVVHAKRGLKDVAIDAGAVTLPTAIGLGIGVIAGNAANSNTSSNSGTHIGAAGGALIGAGVGIAIGCAILLSKKGKRVDVRPGDELKIELAEELHMPTM